MRHLALLIGVLGLLNLPMLVSADDSGDITGTDLVKIHPIIAEYQDSLNVLQKSFEPEELSKAIRNVSQLPTLQAYEVLQNRIERLPDITQILDIPDLKQVVRGLLELYAILGSSDDLERLQDFGEWVRLAMRDKELKEQVQFTINQVVRIKPGQRQLRDLEEVNLKLISLNGESTKTHPRIKLSEDELRAKAHKEALREVEKFYNNMRKKVIGQEPILRSMQNLYLQDLLIEGKRLEPEVFYLMGLPGNGKDTIVEAYLDALHNRVGAHKDHMFAMNIRNKEEAWSYFGSGKGYVGSGELPAFLKFLVKNSGGKYILGEQADGLNTRQVVERNPEWSPGSSIITLGPHKAVVFINEAHNIPKEVKDNVLKQAIERGIFPITNPGSTPNSVEKIELPVTFIFASNEGIELLEPRQRNGSRIGTPLPYKKLHENYERVENDKEALKQAILKTNGGINDVNGPNAPGTSEEFLNRIPSHRLFILEPLSPEQLIAVAKLVATSKQQELRNASGRLGSYNVEISEAMYDFIANYKSIASDNARPIKARVKDFVFDPIYSALQSEDIKTLGRSQDIKIDVVNNEDGSKSAVFDITDSKTGESYQFTRPIRESLNDIPKKPLSQERIDEILQMREKMLTNVFGVEHIVDRLLEAALVSESESRNSGESARPATVMAFLGKSSTGKTETAKQYVKARYGDSAKPAIIDFNGVRTIEAMEAKILGAYDQNKNPIASEFMKAYDRAQGNITFIFDEAANAPKELLKALYEITREANPASFSDGKARPMRNVTIILTGNAGEQIYQKVPQGLSKAVRERAMNEIFKIFVQNKDIQHNILLQTFPEALLARIGQNVFHFGPLQDDGKRQIAQLKLEKGLASLEAKPSERGWKVGFSSEADLINLFEMVETKGFELEQQGASIDKFVRESIIDRIKARLLKDGVSNNQEITIELSPETTVKNMQGSKYLFQEMSLVEINGTSHKIEIPLGIDDKSPVKADRDRVLTAYHEAGHELVSNFYFGDSQRPTYLSIIEGVALLGRSIVPYSGVRRGEVEVENRTNKEVVLRQAAIFAAGYVAQQLVTLGARDDGGKSNDMLRATEMIQSAILRKGLSEDWGVRAIPEGVSTEDFIEKELSQSEKEQLNRLTNDWLKQAETMAREALWMNIDKLFIELSKAIAREGQIYGQEIDGFYEKIGASTERDADYNQKLKEIYEVVDFIDQKMKKAQSKFQSQYGSDFSWDQAESAFNFINRNGGGLINKLASLSKNPWKSYNEMQKMVAASYLSSFVKDPRRDAHLAWQELMPEKVANIENIIATEKKEKTEPVTKPELFRIKDSKQLLSSILGEKKVTGVSSIRCQSIFQ